MVRPASSSARLSHRKWCARNGSAGRTRGQGKRPDAGRWHRRRSQRLGTSRGNPRRSAVHRPRLRACARLAAGPRGSAMTVAARRLPSRHCSAACGGDARYSLGEHRCGARSRTNCPARRMSPRGAGAARVRADRSLVFWTAQRHRTVRARSSRAAYSSASAATVTGIRLLGAAAASESRLITIASGKPSRIRVIGSSARGSRPLCVAIVAIKA